MYCCVTKYTVHTAICSLNHFVYLVVLAHAYCVRWVYPP